MRLSVKHKALADQCGLWWDRAFEEELALYTSKIQAEERERCAVVCEGIEPPNSFPDKMRKDGVK